jgi:hypothetical protein
MNRKRNLVEEPIEMKNIHVLPTDNYSPLVHSTNKYGGYFKSENYSPMKEMGDSYQNIYITIDEEIKEGDWVYCLTENRVLISNVSYSKLDDRFKIILTTDNDLIKNGVQAINDEFLEWFVKNPSCEWVEVNHFGMCCSNQLIAQCINCNQYNPAYKIIIPKEEPKQETLEEAAEQYVIDESYLPVYKEECERSFKNGALWQAERMYSEEDLKEAFEAGHKKGFSGYPNTENWKELPFEKWFEQFKKK